MVFLQHRFSWLVGAYDPYNDFLAGGAGWAAAEADWPSKIFEWNGLPEESLGAAFGVFGDIGDDLAGFMLVMIAFLLSISLILQEHFTL